MPMKADDPNFKGFRAPQYTQVPNEVFDHLLPDMDETELRVTLVAIRKTLGWHKVRDAISLSTFVELTGLSRQGVLDGIEKAKSRGTLVEVGKGKRGINIYELVITDDQSNQLTSLLSRPELVKSVDQSDTLTSLTSRPTKERNIKKPEKEKEHIALTSAAIIDTWLKTQDAIKPNAFKIKHNHDLAKAMIEKGITPEDVTGYIRWRRSDDFWDKFLSLDHISENVMSWKKQTTPTPPPAPAYVYEEPEDLITPEQQQQLDDLIQGLVDKTNARLRKW